MLVNRFISRYWQHKGGSWAERWADRQRKLDALEKWRFDLLFKCPMVMLFIAFPILFYGIYRRLWSLHPFVPIVLVPLAVPVILSYVIVVMVAMYL